ncbi:hypothetical protein BH23CHL5_BH23CHL5_11550 [soil metagenome]
MSSPGVFVAFEGIDGSGKSTQARLLADLVGGSGQSVILTREPGGTPIGEMIRQVLLSDDFEGATARTEALLHTAARAEHVEKVIQPALAAGTHVITDRYLDSTLAYQGGGSGLGVDELLSLQRFGVQTIWPDQRILVRVSVEVGISRRTDDSKVRDRIDRATLDFHSRVAATYDALAARNPEGWMVVNGELDPRTVNSMIVNHLQMRIPALFGSEAPGK